MLQRDWVVTAVIFVAGLAVGFLASEILAAAFGRTRWEAVLDLAPPFLACVATVLLVWVGLSANRVSERMLEVARAAKKTQLTVASVREQIEVRMATIRLAAEFRNVALTLTGLSVLRRMISDWTALACAFVPVGDWPFAKGDEDSPGEFTTLAQTLCGRKRAGKEVSVADHQELDRLATVISERLVSWVVSHTEPTSVSMVLEKMREHWRADERGQQSKEDK